MKLNQEYPKVSYSELNARQKENYNYQKVSSILADYGFVTMRLSDDWQGADFIAQHIENGKFLKVQLKSRMTISNKYKGKDILICFRDGDKGDWYLYPHDEFLHLLEPNISSTASWAKHELYTWPSITKELKNWLCDYKI